MENLNAEQLAATHAEGSCLCIAGPGSGKTRVLAHRIKFLLEERGVSPSQILVITFTRAAAAEMRERFRTLTDGKEYPVLFSTFHALFLRLLREYFGYAGVKITEEEKAYPFAEPEMSRNPKRGMPYGMDEGAGRKREAGNWQNGEKGEAEGKVLRLNELAGLLYAKLEKAPQILSVLRERFAYLLIDEFQDINEEQYRIVRLLTDGKRNLFAVGDDDQAIYGFRGSSPRFLRELCADYPDCRRLFLSVNYRSTPEIVAAAGKVIAKNRLRVEKHIVSAQEVGGYESGNPCNADIDAKKGEKAYIETDTRKPCAAAQEREACRRIRKKQGIEGRNREYRLGESVFLREFASEEKERESILCVLKALPEENALSDTAILLRTNNRAAFFCEKLRQAGIPYTARTTASDFYAKEEIAPVVACLRFVFQGQRRADVLRFMNMPDRGLAREKLTEERVSLSALAKAGKDAPLCRFLASLRFLRRLSPLPAIRYFRQAMGYERYLKEKYEALPELLAEKLENLNELYARAEGFANVPDFLRFIDDSDASAEPFGHTRKSAHAPVPACRAAGQTQTRAQRGVSVLTMHAAKGLEFDTVFLPELTDERLPGRRADAGEEDMEEERRLLYVAMTRAKRRLYMSYAVGERAKSTPSRFLAGLKENLS